MPVVAVVNRKGGSGKSMLATHLAAALAGRGLGVMLGDVDRQPSALPWLRRRAQFDLATTAIVGRAVDPRSLLRAPQGVTHTVLDTPGGLQGFDLARLLMFCDVVLVPVCHSVFDREAAAACFAELSRHPRVASGRCRVAAIGMRVDSRTHGEASLREWAQALGLPFLGVLRETQVYVRCAERGLSIFDLPPAKAQPDLDQWQPILAWLDEQFAARAAREPAAPTRPRPLPAAPRPVPTPAITALPRAGPPQPRPPDAAWQRLWRWLLPQRSDPLRARG